MHVGEEHGQSEDECEAHIKVAPKALVPEDEHHKEGEPGVRGEKEPGFKAESRVKEKYGSGFWE